MAALIILLIAAGGGGAAGLRDVVLRHRRAGGAGRGLADPSPAIGLPWPLAVLQRVRDWPIAALMVSFVAGTATGPFAIQHFNRVANYGVFANLTADFVASVVMMPALALGLAAESLGLRHLFADPAALRRRLGRSGRHRAWPRHSPLAPGSGLAFSTAP